MTDSTSNPVKPFFKSKTVLLNCAVAVVTILSDYQNPEHIAQALALLNVILRFFTKNGITPKLT